MLVPEVLAHLLKQVPSQLLPGALVVADQYVQPAVDEGVPQQLVPGRGEEPGRHTDGLLLPGQMLVEEGVGSSVPPVELHRSPDLLAAPGGAAVI